MTCSQEKSKPHPKVLVGCPVSDYHKYCTEEYIKSIKSLTYDNYDILLVDNSKDDDFYNSIKDLVPVIRWGYKPNTYDRIISCRNLLRQKVLDGGYDYLFSLEQDVIPPRNVIERLLSYEKNIISGVYFKPDIYENYREPVAMLWVLHPDDPNKVLPIRKDIINGNNLIKVDMCGLGCAIIHRKVLEKIRFRYDLADCSCTDDIFFSRDSKKQGFEIHSDTAVKCKHILSGRTWCWKDIWEDIMVKKAEEK